MSEEDNFIEENLNGEDDNDDDGISNELKEKLIKYVKISGLIKEKQKEIRELKEEKNNFSETILNFLTKINEKTINVGNSKISKVEANRKQTLTHEILIKSIKKCLIEKKLITDEKKLDEFIERTFEIANEIREIKHNVSLRCKNI